VKVTNIRIDILVNNAVIDDKGVLDDPIIALATIDPIDTPTTKSKNVI